MKDNHYETNTITARGRGRRVIDAILVDAKTFSKTKDSGKTHSSHSDSGSAYNDELALTGSDQHGEHNDWWDWGQHSDSG
jgi:hypothetical protein